MLTVKDLMQRYKITRQGVRRFVDKHIEEINADGIEHAKQNLDGWIFDAEAVKRIDELRGFSQIAIIEQQESETIKELQRENENLRQLLLIAQSDLIQTQKLLQDSQTKLLTAENQAKENDIALIRTQADLKIEKEMRKIAENKFDESQRQVEKIKKRGLIDRILNKF